MSRLLQYPTYFAPKKEGCFGMVERVKIEASMQKPKGDKAEDVIASPGRRGAPKKYDPKTFPRTAKFLAQRGATQDEIADCFGVTTRTLQYWITQYPELQNAIETGNEVFNPRVERALAERALGYSVDEVQWFIIDKKLEKRIVRKHYPPDVTACIFWLKNRQPEKWRDVHRHDVNVAPLKSSDELRQLLAAEFKYYIDQGLLALPAPDQPMKQINPKANGSGDGHSS
jgi:transposase-like protein